MYLSTCRQAALKKKKTFVHKLSVYVCYQLYTCACSCDWTDWVSHDHHVTHHPLPTSLARILLSNSWLSCPTSACFLSSDCIRFSYLQLISFLEREIMNTVEYLHYNKYMYIYAALAIPWWYISCTESHECCWAIFLVWAHPVFFYSCEEVVISVLCVYECECACPFVKCVVLKYSHMYVFSQMPMIQRL